MELHDPALTVALALGAGILSQVAARHLRVPGIVVLVAVGVLLGPDVAGLIRPEALGEGLHVIVGLAVAVILFEGGLGLSMDRLRREATAIRRLVSLGALVTAAGGAAASHLLMGWGWTVSVLFGTLVIVTGPTVIGPVLRRIRIERNLETILEAEGVLIDAIGAIVAVVALEVVMYTGGEPAALGLLGIPQRLLFGGAVGVLGGIAIGLLLHRDGVVPEGMENMVTLGMVLVLFEVSDAVLPESGIVAAAVAGIVVGNMKTHVSRDLKEFKEQMTVLLIGLLFVLLAADVRPQDVLDLGWPGVATVAVLVFLVRPVGVALCTAGTGVSRRGRLFLSWLAPRGVVAAAGASLFAQRLVARGFAHGEQLQALVFLVIAVTVAAQGLSAGWVAGVLGVRRPSDQGYVLVGANVVARTLARALEMAGWETILIDTNVAECRKAGAAGFRVIFGNVSDDRTLVRADLEARRGLVAVTPNEGVNLLIARRSRSLHRGLPRFVALDRRRTDVRPQEVEEEGARVLFGGAIEFGPWMHRLRREDVRVESWRYMGERPAPIGELLPGSPAAADRVSAPVLPLVHERGGGAVPVTERSTVEAGDTVYVAWMEEATRSGRRRLEDAGFEREASG